MATKVHMEALSPTMEEGRVAKWLKHEGDAVKTGETLAEVETDKAVMDLVARADGNLVKILAAEGATVPVGSVVAYIGAAGEAVGNGEPATTQPAATPQPAAAAATKGSTPTPNAQEAQSDEPPAPHAPARAAAGGGSIKASPLAKRVAQERGVDLKLVQGSGPGGRVILRDVEQAKRGGRDAAGGTAATARVQPTHAPTPQPYIPVADGPSFHDVALSQIRKTIAKRLAASLGPIPHFFLTTDVDMERAAEARESLNRQLGDQGKISYNDIVLKATALALKKHPACNAWYQDDHIRYWSDVHLGMAVAVDEGLITPVLRHADRKSLTTIAAEARELAQRARHRRLKPDEYTGATFTVSNLGMFDIEHFTAVINPPEAGIVAVGSIVPQPVSDADGKVVVRRRVRLTMSCDHRVIDGATGAVFLRTLKQMLENPLAMVL
jgi:pyruvate dehydrogenase E2 component (dihydrolipoamide acetyltransferase)